MRNERTHLFWSIALATTILAGPGLISCVADKADDVKGAVDDSRPPDSDPNNTGVGKADSGNPYLVAMSLESPHPYGNDWNRTFNFDVSGLPLCAWDARFHFESLRTERGYDYLTIVGPFNNNEQRFDGNHDDEWSDWVPIAHENRNVRFILDTDYSIVDNGFSIDKVEWRGAPICPAVVWPLCPAGTVNVNSPPGVCECKSAPTCVPTGDIEVRRNVYRGFNNKGLLLQGHDAFTTAPGPADGSVATNIGTVDEDAVLKFISDVAAAGLFDAPGYSGSGEWTEVIYIRAGTKEVAFSAALNDHTPEIAAVIAKFLALFECGVVDSDMTCGGDYVCADNQCVAQDSCICTEQYEPVCTTNGRTAGNQCKADCAGLGVKHVGECGIPGDSCGTILGLTCIGDNRCRFAESTFEARFPDDGGICVAANYCDAPTDCTHLAHIAIPGQWGCSLDASVNHKTCRWVAGSVWTPFTEWGYSTGNPYGNDHNVWTKLYLPAGATRMSLTFDRFELENGYDFLEVWSWNGSRWKQKGRYTGTDAPTESFAGRYHYIHFVTDYSVVKAGLSMYARYQTN